MKALQIAATGMSAQQMRVDVVSNNLANMSTTGYNARRANFADLMYQQVQRPGSISAQDGTMLPTGVQMGMGVRPSSVSVILGQGVLLQTDDEYPKLRLTEGSWEVMRGQRAVRLVRLVRRKKGDAPVKAAVAEMAWEGVDTAVFDMLKQWRRNVAIERAVPAYVVFNDDTLRELARRRPRKLEDLRGVRGIGEAKLRDYGPGILEAFARMEAGQ